MGSKKAEDIGKRVKAMESKWEGLNDHIKLGVRAIALNLQEHQFERAEKIQKTLTVDWPSLCGTWMVGIRHLIQEAKKCHLANTSAGGAVINSHTTRDLGYMIPTFPTQKDQQ